MLNEEPDEGETLFCTPNTQPDNSHARFAHTDQASPSSGDTQSLVEREPVPARANRAGALCRVTRSRQNPRLGARFRPSIPSTPQNAGSATRINSPPSVRKSTANGRGPFNHYDRSSSITAPLPEADRLSVGNDDSQEFGIGNDFWSDVSMHTGSFEPAHNGESTRAEVPSSAGLATEAGRSSPSETVTTTPQLVLQSIESGDRRFVTAQVNNSLSADGPRASVQTASKKRTSSRPPMNERPSRRSLLGTPSSYASASSSRASASISHDSASNSHASTSGSSARMSNQTPFPAERALPEQAQLNRDSSRAKEEEGTRIVKHPGCVVRRPCIYPGNYTIRNGHPLVTVYGNEVDGSQDMTIGQAEFIISCCSCHWANGFTEVWADAQGEFGHMSKAEVLLAYFQDDLWRAARECCPSRPGHIPCVVVDD